MTEISESLLERVRALLAKAESTEHPAEAEALTGKAAELMAKYGIEQAMLPTDRPGSDEPTDTVITLTAPWASEKASLIYNLASAMRCRGIRIGSSKGEARMHLFGYRSDIERVELLYTSLLVQMAHAIAAAQVPAGARNVRAWRRSFVLGFNNAVIFRVRQAEQRAEQTAKADVVTGGRAELVLADRGLVVQDRFDTVYPPKSIRKTRSTYTGSGYGAGHSAGQRADLGGRRVGGGHRSLEG